MEEVSFESSNFLNASSPTASPVSTMLPGEAPNLQCTFKRKPGTIVEFLAYGLIHPILTIIVAFANVNGIIILVRLRSFTQTNLLLLSIFIADLLTTAIPLPKLFVQYIANMNRPQTPHYPWCYLSSLSFPVLPVITNNISIWFVVLLSIQRYTCVWKRDAYDRIFSRNTIVASIVGITLFTASFHSVLLIDNYRVPLKCTDPNNGNEFEICNEDSATFIIPGGTELETYVLSTYYLSRIVIFHVIPIIAITVSTLLLIRILVQAESTRRRLFKQGGHTPLQAQRSLAEIDEAEKRAISQKSCRKPSTKESNNTLMPPGSEVMKGMSSTPAPKPATKNSHKTQRISTTTHMLMIISAIYLVQHFFQSILFISGVVLNVLAIPEPHWLLRAITIQNLLRWAGFPANFFLCLHVQEPFREMFNSMYQKLFKYVFFCKSFRKSVDNSCQQQPLQTIVNKSSTNGLRLTDVRDERRASSSAEVLPLIHHNQLQAQDEGVSMRICGEGDVAMAKSNSQHTETTSEEGSSPMPPVKA